MNSNSYLYDADRNDLMRSVMTVEDAEFLNMAGDTPVVDDHHYEEKRDAQIEHEVDEILMEKQGDLEDAARDSFLER